MFGRPYEPIVQLSTPLTRLAVMEGRTLAIGTFNAKLDDNFNIVAENDEEFQKIKAGMESVEQRITAEMDPILTARQLDTDEIILFRELRPYLETMTEMCYQSIGYRRVKNPRIWSMHDVNALG